MLAAVAGGVLLLGWPQPLAGWLATPVDAALTAIVGTLGRVATSVLPPREAVWVRLAHDAVLVAAPGLTAVVFAVAAQASEALRRALMGLTLLASVGAWWLLDGWQATLAMAMVAAVAAAVAFGTRWAVTLPLAALSGALAVRTVLALAAGTSPTDPALDLASVGLDGRAADLAASAARWVLAVVPFGVAVRIWRRR